MERRKKMEAKMRRASKGKSENLFGFWLEFWWARVAMDAKTRRRTMARPHYIWKRVWYY